MVAVSVIIPIYKVEMYIERCARSLLEQTFQDVEYIFVDDGSPDNSIDVLKKVIIDYPQRTKQVRIISLSENKGLPAARNAGMRVAKGEYIFHCDSDDWVENDMLMQLYGKAKEEDADIVWCDWFLSFSHNERYMRQPQFDTTGEALEGILKGLMKYNVWNKLVKRSLYAENQITFLDGYGMGEDMTMIKLFACAHHVTYLPKAFYHYVKINSNSFTNIGIVESHIMSLLHNVDSVVDFIQEHCQGNWNKEIGLFKLNVKYPLLISPNSQSYRLWQRYFPESNVYIRDSKKISFRAWALQYAATKSMFGILKLHYLLMHKFVYGVIFR